MLTRARAATRRRVSSSTSASARRQLSSAALVASAAAANQPDARPVDAYAPSPPLTRIARRLARTPPGPPRALEERRLSRAIGHTSVRLLADRARGTRGHCQQYVAEPRQDIAQTRFAACCVTILFGPSNISSLSSTFLLTGKQCITFALFVTVQFFFCQHPFGIIVINFSIIIISAPVFYIYKIRILQSFILVVCYRCAFCKLFAQVHNLQDV